MKFISASDIHGSEIVRDKICKFGKESGINTLILSGDVVSKFLYPIIERGEDEIIAYTPFGAERFFTRKEAKRREAELKKQGYITWYGKLEELERMSDKEKRAYSLEFQRKSLEKMISEFRKHFENFLMILGNDDSEHLLKYIPNENNLNERIVKIEGIEFLGFPYIPKTPFNTSFEIEEEREIERKLEKLISELKNPENSVWITHAPPYKSGLDVCKKINDNLELMIENGMPLLHYAGSEGLRRMIEKYKPRVVCCGHIHESPGIRHIGETICVNPGSQYEEGIARIAVVDLGFKPPRVETFSLI